MLFAKKISAEELIIIGVNLLKSRELLNEEVKVIIFLKDINEVNILFQKREAFRIKLIDIG